MNRFKMIAGALLISLLMVGVASAAGGTNVVTNALGQVITTVYNEYGRVTTTIVDPNQPASQSRAYIGLSGIQVARDGATTTTNTLYTPRDIGDLLLGYQAGSNALWFAVGPASTDWLPLLDSTP